MNCIHYKEDYKYQIVKEYTLSIDIKAEKDIETSFLALTTSGQLTIKKGYAWNGPSGPTIDTLNFMRGSLVHDAIYQLIRDGYLDKEKYRKPADKLLRKICREDGMNPIRAFWVYRAVRMFGDPGADPAASRPVIKAPRGCG